jgi:hypothetical protein
VHTVYVWVRPLWRRKCYGLGWNLSWWSHSAQIFQGPLNAVKYRDDILDPIVRPFCNSKTLITSFNMAMQNVTWLVFVQTFWTRITSARLVIRTSRTVGSAKKFVRITSGFGGGEFTKTLRMICTCQQLKFAFLLLEYCRIRECYAVANAFTIRNMYCLLLYMKCYSRKINRPTKNMTKIVTLTFLSCSWQRCKLNFQYFFIVGV